MLKQIIRMKKNIFIISLLAVSLLSSCGLIKVDADDKLPGDEFWIEGNAGNVETYMLSIYNNFRKATMMKSAFFVYSGDFRCAPIGYYSGDRDLLGYLTSNDMAGLKSRYDSGNNGEGSVGQITNWNYFFQVVQGANILLKEIDEVPDMTDQQVRNYKAEAIFMRNLAYFFMVRLFGDIPYYTVAYNSEPLSRTSMVTVLQNCLADLQALIDSDPDKTALPWRYSLNSKSGVRATRGAVLALMMHINLWLVRFDSKQSNTYYQNVVSLGDELVNRNDNSYELVDMNRSSFIFKGGTKESLFEIAQNINSNEIFDQTAIFSNHFAYSCYINRTTPSYYYKREFLIKLFPVNGEDKRVSSWFNDNIYMSDKIDLYPKEITKFMNPDTYRGDNITSNSGNQIVFRFADAILLYAEALAAIGEEGEAQVQLNKIRDRAGATSVMSTGTDLQNDIFWERVRELIGEGHYYYDLVRTGKIHDINFCETPISRSKFNEGAWTWPICRKALVNNPYMTLNNYWE